MVILTKANNGLAWGVNSLCQINGDDIGEIWKNLGKTFSGEDVHIERNSKRSSRDVPSKTKKVEPADEICECLVVSTKKSSRSY